MRIWRVFNGFFGRFHFCWSGWLIAFAIGAWLTTLSGFGMRWTGTPGFIQSFELRHLAEAKRQQIQEIEQELAGLRRQIKAMQTNAWVQESEVRRVLNYARADELVFVF